MAQNTKLTPQDVIEMSKKHTALADEITSQQSKLNGDIQTLTGSNHGALMTKLTTVHGDWNTSTTGIVNNLREMADTLASVAQRLKDEDEQNASSVTY